MRRSDSGRRARFYQSYISDMINSDVRQVTAIERPADLRWLLTVLAAQMATLPTPGTLAGSLNLPAGSPGPPNRSPCSEDFRDIHRLACRLGERLLAGIVLHTGQQPLPIGECLRALPIPALWTT